MSEKKLMSPEDAHKVVFAIRSRLSRDNEREALEVALDCLQLQFEDVRKEEEGLPTGTKSPDQPEGMDSLGATELQKSYRDLHAQQDMTPREVLRPDHANDVSHDPPAN